MKKKLITFGIGVALVLGIGNVVYANGGSDDSFSFGEMLPMMKSMHPDMNEQQLSQMYQDCHGSDD